MYFESLANELLLDLFEYFNAIDLFRVFYGLNSRFDELLMIHFRAYNVDFQSVSKRDFDIFCVKYLPLIIKRVVSFRLSNDHETPDLPDHFLRYKFTINQFTHLKYLKLHAFDSIMPLLNILSGCRHLAHLTHVKITECPHRYGDNFNDLIESIWHLPNLTHCHLNSRFVYPFQLKNSTLISSETIKYVFMKNILFSPNDRNELFTRTPNLQYFNTTFEDNPAFSQPFIVVPSITNLNLTIKNPLHLPGKFFELMPNLSHVTLEIIESSNNTYLNGHQWKQFIIDHLFNIKVFRFFVRYQFSGKTDPEETVDKILDTFRTPFWLHEHRWFIQCQWIPQLTDQTISLYTLPSCSSDVYALYSSTVRSKSTCSLSQNDCASNDVCLTIHKNEISNINPAHILFSKIGHLKITLPTDRIIWSFISTLDHLISLEVSLTNKTGLSQLQALIDQAPRCSSLTVKNASASQLAQLDITYTQLRRVFLIDYCFNAPECSLLANSSLGRQCEVLSIAVTDRRHVPDLIKEMPNLRALTCYCEDNKWDVDESLSSAKKSALEWLQDQLPSTYSIRMPMTYHENIQIWIG